MIKILLLLLISASAFSQTINGVPNQTFTGPAAALTTNFNLITMWGDSLSLGNQSGDGITVPNQLQGLSGRVVSNQGVSGNTSAQILTRVSAGGALLNGLNIFWAGENDNWATPSTTEANIASMVAAVPAGAQYIVMGIVIPAYATSGQVTQIQAINSNSASTYGSHYVDIPGDLLAAYFASNAVDTLNHTSGVTPFTLRASSSNTLSSSVNTSSCPTLTTADLFPGSVLIIASEYVNVLTVTSGQAATCTRGYASTTAAAYSSGQLVQVVDPTHLGRNLASPANTATVCTSATQSSCDGYVLVANEIETWIAANPPTNYLPPIGNVNAILAPIQAGNSYTLGNPLVATGGSSSANSDLFFQYNGVNVDKWEVGAGGAGNINLVDIQNFVNPFSYTASTQLVTLGTSGNGFAIDKFGKAAFGNSPTAGTAVVIAPTIAGATSGDSYGLLSEPSITWNTSSGGSVWGVAGVATATASSGTIGSFAALFANGAGSSVSGGVAVTNAYGLYATAPSAGVNNYAGYFNGNVTVSNTLTANNGITTFNLVNANVLQTNGFTSTTTGCSSGTNTGHASAGTFTIGANTCTVVLSPNSSSHLITATVGWACSAWDQTHPLILIGGNSSSNTTTASFTIPSTATSGDVIAFSCTAY